MSLNQKYQKKTILQVVPALISGGVERGTLETAKSLMQNGYNSIVVSAGGPMVEGLVASGAKHIMLDVASKNPIKIWRNAKALSSIIREHNVDIIHARSRAPAWSCYMAASETKIKLITTFHGIYKFNNFLKKYYNSVMTEGDRVIAVSNFVKKHIIDNYDTNSEKITVIHRGVNHNEFSKEKLSQEKRETFLQKYTVPKDKPVLLLPSRMTRWKGQAVLVEALEKIRDLDFYCIIAGDLAKHPNYVAEIKDKIRKYKMQSHIQLFGHEPDMRALYGISDIVLSTSIEPEAFGRTIIEAQSMEKIVIATNIGGACETIQNGENGFHVKPNDSDDLAEKIKYCLSMIGSDKEREITTNARKTASENFSLNKMLASINSIYNQM